MSALDIPAGRALLLDTSTVIAYLEGAAATSLPATTILDQLVASGRNRAVVSAITVMEVLVRPLRLGDAVAARTAADLFATFPNLTVRTVDVGVAERAAALRAATRCATADALIIASGLEAGARDLVTNDHAWRALAQAIGGVTVWQLEDLAR